MTPAEIARIADIARERNDRAFAAGHFPTRYVENIDVLNKVAAIMTEHEADGGGGGHARPA